MNMPRTIPMPPFLKRFGRFVWREIGKTFHALFMYLAISLIFMGLITWWATRKPDVPEGATLLVQLDRRLADQTMLPSGDALTSLLTGGAALDYSAPKLAKLLKRAATDDRIKDVVLVLDHFAPSGPAPVLELTQGMDAVRAAGKPVTAYASTYGPLAYLAAAHADTILLDPLGMVDLSGFSQTHLYYKDLIDKTGGVVHAVKAGKYKSATESFERASMSDEAREAGLKVLRDHWQSLIAHLEPLRGDMDLSFADKVAQLSQRMATGGDTAQHALDLGLVDALASPARTAELLGLVNLNDDETAGRMLPAQVYQKAIDPLSCSMPTRKDGKGGTIAIVVLEGEITQGGAKPGAITPGSTVPLFQRLRKSKNLAAVVLRIDTPGGDVVVSEQVRAEILALKDRGVHVVASLGSVAASGGYWIASAADEIYATPLTTTGSIGAFALIPSASGLIDRLGVHAETLHVGPGPNYGTLVTDVSPAHMQAAQMRINHVYDSFVTRVAEGRELSREDVEAAAGGRIWAAQDAQRLRLIDGVYVLDDVIVRTAQKVGTDPACNSFVRMALPLGTALQALQQQISLGQHEMLATWAQLKGLMSPLPDNSQALAARVQCLTCVPITY